MNVKQLNDMPLLTKSLSASIIKRIVEENRKEEPGRVDLF